MPSPICEVREGAGAYQSTTYGVDVSAGASITIRLADITDVNSWSIQCITTDDANSADAINNALTVDAVAKTATFTGPALPGAALRFRSVVNSGLDANGVVDDDLETTFCIYVPTGDGRRVIAADETTEGHPDHGWIKSINDLIRTVGLTAGDAVAELPLIYGEQTTTASIPTRKGGRKYNFSNLPASIGSLTREVRLVAELDSSADDVDAVVDLYDLDHGAIVDGSEVSNAGAADKLLPYEVQSAPLTLGTSDGDLRTDGSFHYIARLRRDGGSASDAVTCTSARLVIRYV